LKHLFSICLMMVSFYSCNENPNEPIATKEKILKTQEVIFFSSDRDGKATNIFMMTPDGEIIKQITKYNWGEFVAMAISPDSNQLLFYQAAPGLDITVGMDTYIYKIKEDTIIGPITQGHPGNFTPDGKKFAFSRHTFTMQGGFESIYLYDLTDSSETKLTEDEHTSFHPQISPDGNYIAYGSAFFSDSMHYWQLHLMDINGGYITNLTAPNNAYYASSPVFTPDGQSVVFYYCERQWIYDICRLDINTNAINYITLNHVNGRYDITSNFYNPNVSKDGTKVYFYSNIYDYQYPQPVEIYSINMDGTQLKKITNNIYWDSHPISGIVSFYLEK